MINQDQAVLILKKHIPDAQIKKVVKFNNLYVFTAYYPDEYEGQMDPFYSVDCITGAFKNFPYLDPKYFDKIMNLMISAPDYTNSSD